MIHRLIVRMLGIFFAYQNIPLTLGTYLSFQKYLGIIKVFWYSDHTVGIEACLIAASKCVDNRKTFYADKSDTTIRDHALSATPDEFRLLVNTGRTINQTLILSLAA